MTEYGRDIGMGHLTRCQALRSAFGRAGVASTLWVESRDVDETGIRGLERSVPWSCLVPGLEVGLVAALGLVVDSFTVGEEALRRLGELNPRIAFLDDFPARRYESGVVVDWTIGAERSAFPQRHPDVCYLLGSTYCTLRKEFRVSQGRSFHDFPERVLITCGGSDPRRMTGPLLLALQHSFPSLRLDVVLGRGVRDASSVVDLGGARTTFHRDVGAVGMQALMAAADVVICGGGQTLYEAASQGLPAIAIKFIDNQTADIRGFSEAGFCHAAGAWDAPDVLDHVVASLHRLWAVPARRASSKVGRAAVDGRGGDRLAGEMLRRWRQPVGNT